MRKIFRLLTIGALACGFCACSDDPTDAAIQPANQLYLPRDNYSVELAKGLPVTFEWASSKSADNGYIVYELLFDKEDGDFSHPLYVVSSANNGVSTNVEIASTTLNTVALLAGADYGETAHVKWTVRAWKDRSSIVYNTAQYLSLLRLDVMPLEVKISGAAVEGGEMQLGAALPVASQKGKHIADTEAGSFEGFVKLSAGKLTISDDLGYYYRMDENSVLTRFNDESAAEERESTIAEEGVYWLYLKFSTKVYSMKKIDQVAVWTNPWWGGHFGLEPLNYVGNGVWEVKDYAWDIADGGFDSRYHFNVTYADGSEERWGYWDDDCRNNANPDGDAKFFNVYRFNHSTMNDDWAHSWKTRENIKEGGNMLVSFRVCMNQQETGNYYHERSFSPRSDLVGTSVEISGSAAENGALKLNAALPVISADGRYDKTERVADTYECFTQLSAGELIVKDDIGHFFTLADGALKSSDSEVKNAVSQPGIYWISIDLKAKSYVMKQIEKVELWNNPWFGSRALKEMNYDGNGVWSVENYAWTISNGDRIDSRYYFVATYTDGTKERWAFWDDDCRNSANPDEDAKFFNVYRFDDASWTDPWKHAYKTRENIREGENSLATFRLHMNNTDKADYYHERSFRGLDEVFPTEVKLSGVTENGAEVAMFGARKIGQEKHDIGQSTEQEKIENTFEVYTKLSAGELTVKDDLNREWQLLDGGTLTIGSAKKRVDEGIYYIQLDFANKTWKMKKITKVILQNKCWQHQSSAEMTYENNGVWAIYDHDWNVALDNGGMDSRYYFIVTYADNSQERWGHGEDDCRQNAAANKPSWFFNVFRFDHSKIDEWSHTWKANESTGEGRNKLVTIHVYMNSDNGNFYHERSFKDK